MVRVLPSGWDCESVQRVEVGDSGWGPPPPAPSQKGPPILDLSEMFTWWFG